ncbi:collagen-like protein, partial [Streptomyces katsurahamanus]|nr:collagen-like protein [Streptomyces katsurahamanus]
PDAFLGVEDTRVTFYTKSNASWIKRDGEVRGAKWYINTASTPSENTRPGDILLRADTGDIWQRGETSWGSKLGNIRGPQGVQGIQGIQGVQGPTGPQGLKGDKGDVGATGATGPRGVQGEASTVPGPVGPKGDTGPVGPQGLPGPRGPQGEPGKDGVGAGTVTAVNGVQPDGTGLVTLSPADIGAVTATNARISGTLSLDGAAGYYRPIRLQTLGVDRWQLQNDGTAESGADAGSNFRLSARKDDGTDSGVALFVRRDNRRVVVNGTSTQGEAALTANGPFGVKDVAADPANATGGVQLYSKAGLPYVKQGDGTVFQLGGVPSGVLTVADKAVPNGVAPLNEFGNVPSAHLPDLGTTYLKVSTRGQANGVASLDADGLIPAAQLPAAPSGGAKNAWTPQAMGFEAWTCDPYGVANPVAKAAIVKRLYCGGINITEPTTVNAVVMFARGWAGSTAAATARFGVAIYRENGTRVQDSGILSNVVMTGQDGAPGMKNNHIGAVPIKLKATTTLTPGRYWAAFIMTAGTATDFYYMHVQNESPSAPGNFHLGPVFHRAFAVNNLSAIPTTVNQLTAEVGLDPAIMALAMV